MQTGLAQVKPTLKIFFSRAAVFYFFLVIVSAILVTYFRGGHHFHFYLWVDAARKFLSGVNPGPIMTDPGGWMSAYLYPPSTSLLFAPFLPLPLKWGQLLYLLICLSVFLSGFFALLKTLKTKSIFFSALMYLVLSSDMVGSIIPVRVEILTAGVACWAVVWLTESRLIFFSGFLLGLSASWKLQALPILALILLVALIRYRHIFWKLFSGSLLGLAFLPLLSAMLVPWDLWVESFQTWWINMKAGSAATWYVYQNVPALLNRHFGWPTQWNLGGVQISILAGILFAGLTAYLARTTKNPWFVALVLGALHVTLFSPMSQGSGYVLATPAILAAFLLREEQRTNTKAFTFWTVLILIYWVLTHLIYSDLALPDWRGMAQTNMLRPIGFVLLSIAIIGTWLRDSKRHRA